MSFTQEKESRKEYCSNFQASIENESELLSKIIPEANFLLNGKVNRHNVRIWGSLNPHAAQKVERDYTKVIASSAIKLLVYGSSFFEYPTVTGHAYWEVLIKLLFPSLVTESNGYIIQ